MADITLVTGTPQTLTPIARKAGTVVPFPTNTTYQWTASPALQISDPTAATLTVTATADVPDDGSATVILTVVEDGFTHSRTHTVATAVVVPPVDTIDEVDFSAA